MDRRRFVGLCGQCVAGAALGGLIVRDLGAAGAGAASSAAPPAAADPLGLGLEQWNRTVCDLCGLGEPVFIGTKGGRVAAVKGIPRSTLGFGRLCPRARGLVAAAVSEDRALQPMLRPDPNTKGTLAGLVPASWDDALAAAARGIAAARGRLGADGVGIFASDGETSETYSLLGRLARAGLGTDHIDTPARLDALHAYEACRAVFGAPANPATIEDVDAAGLIVLVGGDFADSHPALFHRVLDARRAGGAKVVLIDARRTEAAAVADLHVRARPGHELAVVNALAARLTAGAPPAAATPWRNWLAGRVATPAPGVRAPLARPAATVASRHSGAASLRDAGVDAAVIAEIGERWNGASGVVTLVGPIALGHPAGAALARATAQLHHATGQWGRPGRGVMFLPRGANSTGVVALGIAPGLLPAGRADDAAARGRVAAAYGVPADRLPERSGLAALEWPAALRSGRMGSLLVLRANVAAEMPDAGAWREALRSTFVVAATTHVPTETTLFADVVLPLAFVTGETAGTMMTLDRRCQSLEQAARPPGEARTTGEILAGLAQRLVGAEVRGTIVGEEPWSPYAEWDRWRALAAGTPLDAAGITIARLRRELGIAWPCATEQDPGTARLVPAAEVAFHVPTPMPGTVPRTTAERPLLLVVGPVREHFRSRVVTGRAPELHYESPYPQLEVNPADGAALGLLDGEWVVVESAAGSAAARLWLTDRAAIGAAFLPEHFGFLSDLQGGSLAQKEPEGLAYRVTAADLVSGSDSPAGLLIAVSVRKAQRRDLRQRGA